MPPSPPPNIPNRPAWTPPPTTTPNCPTWTPPPTDPPGAPPPSPSYTPPPFAFPEPPPQMPPPPPPPPSRGLRPTVSWGGSWRPEPRGRTPVGAKEVVPRMVVRLLKRSKSLKTTGVGVFAQKG